MLRYAYNQCVQLSTALQATIVLENNYVNPRTLYVALAELTTFHGCPIARIQNAVVEKVAANSLALRNVQGMLGLVDSPGHNLHRGRGAL